MARNSSPEADALLDKPIPVLDLGFVRLVDYLGSDDRIVQAARVSYGEGTKTVREDAALIDYLLRNRHTSPFEMVELTLHIKAPIFVARQWLRHRSACLSGDAELYFDEPAAISKGKRKFRRMRVDEFYDKWHNGCVQMHGPRRVSNYSELEAEREYSVAVLARKIGQREESIRNHLREGKVAHKRIEATSPTSPQLFVKGSDWLSYARRRVPVVREQKERLQEMNLRMCDETTGEINHTKVLDIWQAGVKPVFEVTLDNGYKLKMTKDHRCLTEVGWMTLEAATGLRLRGDGGVTWREEAPRFSVNGVPAHRDRTWLSERRAQGPGATKLVRSHSSVTRIEYVGEEMTFDLEVAGPYHNFVANGFVVHNSVNEVSGRYSVLADEFYRPTPDQIRAQGKRSRQVGEGSVESSTAQKASDSFDTASRKSYETYQELLADGVAREMAREVLPVGLYTEFYWKQDLHNLFHFLRLRMDWHAQFEIRAYGDAVAQCARAVAPRAYEAFEEHILHGRSLSRRELDLLRKAVDSEKLGQALAESGLRASRQREFLGKLGIEDVPVETSAKPASEPVKDES